MMELFSKYSVSDIIIFLVIFGSALKGFFSFWDWGFDRLKKFFGKQYNKEQFKKEVEESLKKQDKKIEEVKNLHKENSENIEKIVGLVQVLIDSDKDDIKSFITKEHHYFCYEKGFIDDYSLDCLEKRFKHYQDEGGNSFAEDLMNDLRALPKVAMTRDQDHK